MSLIVPPFGFSKFAHNYQATPAFNAIVGTTVTTGASNADGSTASCLSALGFDVQLLEIDINTNNTTATDTSTLVHVVIDPAGGTAWDTTNKLITNILAGFAGTGGARSLYFPVRIPSGATVGALGRNVTGSTRTVGVGMRAFGGLTRPELWPTCDEVISFGDTAASSKGTTITPGAAGAAGTWTSVGSTTAKDLFGVVLAVQGVGAVISANSLHVEVGISSTALAPPFYITTSSAEQVVALPSFPVYFPIPSGSQLQVRATTNSGVTTFDVCLYGLG